MVALVIVSTFIVLILGILVTGLLRSHADILRALHDLGAGVGDPSTASAGSAPVAFTSPATSPTLGAAPAVAGLTPTGDARAIAVDNSDDFTLLGFLSSGCTGCAAFWEALQEPGRLTLPDRTRVVIVTKGPDREIPSEVQAKSTGRVPVVMSTEAWLDYEVPGSPFFVLVDGATGRKVGQGVASWPNWSVGLNTTAATPEARAAGARRRSRDPPGKRRPTRSWPPPGSSRATRACTRAPSTTSSRTPTR
jgi:hypothetical protein